MAFISGPRQVGKTTLAKGFLLSTDNYLSWDDARFRRVWSRAAVDSIATIGEGPVVFDEIHKDRRWKSRLKGIYDLRGDVRQILVTGSARLDLYRRGGDSLSGRYIPYRLHPFSVGERPSPPMPDTLLQPTSPCFRWQDLLHLGGFPEPLLGQSERLAQRWSRLRTEQLVREEVRDIRAISDLRAMQVLVDLLPLRVGSLFSLNALREEIGIAYGTLRDWISVLEALFFCFRIAPYAKKINRAIRSEPKIYVYDTLRIDRKNHGARQENLVALHLLKACQFWTDIALGEFDLRFVRDKEKREVDFLILRDSAPWLLVECKSTNKTPSPALFRFAQLLKPTHAVQLVSIDPYDRSYPELGVRVLSYERFLAALP